MPASTHTSPQSAPGRPPAAAQPPAAQHRAVPPPQPAAASPPAVVCAASHTPPSTPHRAAQLGTTLRAREREELSVCSQRIVPDHERGVWPRARCLEHLMRAVRRFVARPFRKQTNEPPEGYPKATAPGGTDRFEVSCGRPSLRALGTGLVQKSCGRAQPRYTATPELWHAGDAGLNIHGLGPPRIPSSTFFRCSRSTMLWTFPVSRVSHPFGAHGRHRVNPLQDAAKDLVASTHGTIRRSVAFEASQNATGRYDDRYAHAGVVERCILSTPLWRKFTAADTGRTAADFGGGDHHDRCAHAGGSVPKRCTLEQQQSCFELLHFRCNRARHFSPRQQAFASRYRNILHASQHQQAGPIN